MHHKARVWWLLALILATACAFLASPGVASASTPPTGCTLNIDAHYECSTDPGGTDCVSVHDPLHDPADYYDCAPVGGSYGFAASLNLTSYSSPGPHVPGTPVTLHVTTPIDDQPLTVASADANCTVDPSTNVVTLVNGDTTCYLTVSQVGDELYAAPSNIQLSIDIFNVNHIEFDPLPSPPIAGSSVTLTAHSPSSSPFIWAVDGSTASTCSIDSSSGLLTFSPSGGDCLVSVRQVPDGHYAADIQYTFIHSVFTQAITFTSTAPTNAVVGVGSYTPSATGGDSGNEVTFSLAPTSTGCSLSTGVVQFTSLGTCTINADQVGSLNYADAPTAQQSFAVSLPQSAPPADCTASSSTDNYICDTEHGPASHCTPVLAPATQFDCMSSGGSYDFDAHLTNLHATPEPPYLPGDSTTLSVDTPITTQPVVYTSQESSVCSVDAAGVVTFVLAISTCTINVSQTGDGMYAAPSDVSISLNAVNPTVLTITPPAEPGTVGDTLTLSATSFNPNTITWDVDPISASNCSVLALSGEVHFQSSGLCRVRAHQAASPAYGPGEASIDLNPLNASDLAIQAPVGSTPSVGAPYQLSATSSSTSPIVWATTTPTVCSVDGTGLMTFTDVALCRVTASQVPDVAYGAGSAELALSVQKGDQIVIFTSDPGTVTYGDADYQATASGGGSDNAITFSTTSTSVCTVTSSGVVTWVGLGLCAITADQPGSALYNEGSATQNVQVFGLDAALEIIAPAAATVYPGATIQLVTASLSSAPITFTSYDAPSVCTVSAAGQVTFVSRDPCTAYAFQDDALPYQGSFAMLQMTPGKIPQVVTFSTTAPTAAVVGGNSYVPEATGGDSGNPVLLSLDPTSTGCTLTAGVVEFSEAGQCIIDAAQDGDDDYAPGSAQQSFAVNEPTPTPSSSPSPTPPNSPSPTPPNSPSPTPPNSPSPTPPNSPSPTPSSSPSPTPSPTPSNSPSPTPSPTPTPTRSNTPSPTPTPTRSSTPTPRPTPSQTSPAAIPAVPVVTPTPTPTPPTQEIAPSPTQPAPLVPSEAAPTPTARSTSSASPSAAPAVITPTPTPTKTSGAGEVPPGLSHRNVVTRALHTTGELDTSAEAVGSNLLIVILLLILVALPPELVNHTFEHYYDEIVKVMPARFVRFFRKNRGDAGIAPVTVAHRMPANSLLLPALALVTSAIYGFLDPEFGFNRDSVTHVLGITISLMALTVVFEMPAVWWVRLRAHQRTRMRIFPGVVPIAILCVVLSRILHIHPGFLLGAIGAAATVADDGSVSHEKSKEDGRGIFIGAISLLSFAAVTWVGWSRFSGHLEHIDEPSTFLLIVDTALSSFVAASLEILVFGLVPLPFLKGEQVFQWSRTAWAFAFGTGAFGLLWLLVHPSGDITEHLEPAVKALSPFIAMAVASILFWGYFLWRDRLSKRAHVAHA